MVILLKVSGIGILLRHGIEPSVHLPGDAMPMEKWMCHWLRYSRRNSNNRYFPQSNALSRSRQRRADECETNCDVQDCEGKRTQLRQITHNFASAIRWSI